MDITSAQYKKNLEGDNYAIIAVIEGQTWGVPMQVGNHHYDEILKQVEAGTLTIQNAD